MLSAAVCLNMLHLEWSTIKADYFRLVNTVVPGPQSWTYFVPHILLPVSFLLPPHILSHDAQVTLIFPIILASTIHAVTAMKGPDVISMDTLWWSLYFLVLKNPRRDFQRVREQEGGPRSKLDEVDGVTTRPSSHVAEHGKLVDWPYPSFAISRLKWTLALLLERPLTSWKIGQVSHDARVSPPYIKQSRFKFVKDILSILVPALLLFMPLSLRIHAIEHQNELSVVPGLPRNSNFDTFPLSQAPAWSILRTLHQILPAGPLKSLNLGLFLYSFLVLGFLGVYLIPPLLSCLISPASGTTHTWSPHLWPRPHFGPFAAVLDTGLRGLWGSWWHQQMRHAVSEPGRWFSDRCGLRRGTLRYGIICTSAFLLSGITHMGLVPPDIEGAWRLRLLIGGFFFAQPLGILAEVMVIEKILRQVEATINHSRMRIMIVRTLRLCWVLLFMSLPLALLGEPFEELGYWNIWPPFVSNVGVKSVLIGEWIP